MRRNSRSQWADAFARKVEPAGLLHTPDAGDCSDEEWVAGIVRVVGERVPGRPCTGMLVDISDPAGPVVRMAAGGDPRDVDDLHRLVETWPASSAPGFTRRLFTGARCFTVSARLDEKLFQAWRRNVAPDRGIEDAFCLVACVRSGEGVLLWFPLDERTRVPRRALARWERVADEVLKALRRRREGDDGTSPPKSARVPIGARRGKNGEGAQEALGLRLAVQSALGATEASCEPDATVAFLSELLAGHWYLLDHFDADGRYYFAWERNDSQAARARALTERERQVLRRVASGHGDRAIATDFGCSSSTVATHRLRAMSKLGIGSRTLLTQVLVGIGRLDGQKVVT
jgi:DNA-binding CsgD family transcriptional regulator